MRPVLLLLFLAALCAMAAVSEDEVPVWNGTTSKSRVEDLCEEYFDADASQRQEIRAFLDDLGTLRDGDLKKYRKSLEKLLKKQGPRLKKERGETFTHGGLTGLLHYVGRDKRGSPLVIALHGGGQGQGDGASALRAWNMAGSKALVLAPTAPELRSGAWNQEDIEQWVLALAEAAVRTFDLDRNRVYLVGHSMGGFGTWSIGSRHADRFAALVSGAGGIWRSGQGGEREGLAPGHIPNLLNTPIRFFHSTDDARVAADADQAADRYLTKLKERGYDYEWIYDEYDDIGHGFPPDGLKPLVDWMLEHEREPYPKTVVWEPSRAGKRRFFWLEQQGGDAALEGRIVDNQVRVTSKGRRGRLTVYLHEELVNLKKPITLLVDGRTAFEGVVRPRLSVLLHTLATGRDAEQYYAHSVVVGQGN